MFRKPFMLFIAIFIVTAAMAQEALVQGVAPKNYLDHTVAAKETLFGIGRMYNAAPKDIAAFNAIPADKGVAVGQKLKIPLSKTNFSTDNIRAAADEMHVPVYYYVKEHEGLYRIALNNGLTLARLKEMNGLTKDDIATGKKLQVGYLILKNSSEAEARFGGKGMAVPREEPPAVVKEEPKKDPPPVVTPVKKPVEETKPPAPVEEVKTIAGMEEGFFKSDFQKTRYSHDLKSISGTSAVFKTVSGFQDAKYYALMDGVEPGNIIQVTNPATGKTIYAKVLGEMQELRQNHGLVVRLSNAAATALNASGEKFDVAIKY